MGWADRISIQDVKDAKTFSDYARQVCGVPYPTKSALGQTQKLANELFEQYPALTWQALCQVVLWAKFRKKRFPHSLALLNAFRWAYADGYLPELDVEYEERAFKEQFDEALRSESDPEWRRRLLEAHGPGRVTVFEAWNQRRKVTQ